MIGAPVEDLPLKPSLEEFRARCGQGNLIPVYTELTADYETPTAAFQQINNGQYCFLLESAETHDELGRYSFVGSDPRTVFQARGRTVTVSDSGGASSYESEGDPLSDLEQLMAQYKPVADEGLPLFYGGAVGYLSYDTVRFFEPTVPDPPEDTLGVPDMVFMITDTVVIFDHRYRRIKVVANVFVEEHADPDAAYESARRKVNALVMKLSTAVLFKPLLTYTESEVSEPVSNTSKEEYMAMVEKAREYIHAGDVFQLVPSQRFEAEFGGTPIDLYRALRSVNPSPYMFCLQFPDDFALVGCSPEVHVRAIDGKIDIRPIAGTRWRGKTPQEDDALADELLADPKERAEHIMLVDLARNDVGRVSEYASVEVDDLMIIERYSHVMHIVSNVSGTLRPDRNAYDVMRATFPAGTVSGSPKVRAMQIINELEKSKRCAYSGAVGYFGFDGNHDSCIALRTAVVRGKKVYVQAGAGVVADSDPEYEYNETVNKATALMRAIERAKAII
ncbi:MAG: anthranilate synthase component I [Verrucomicrobiales bacterium]